MHSFYGGMLRNVPAQPLHSKGIVILSYKQSGNGNRNESQINTRTVKVDHK